MNEGRVLHGSYNGVQVLRYIGNIRYTLSFALDTHFKELLKRPSLQGFVVDLSLTDTIDSTNLGILARLARAMQRLGLPQVTLISNRESINEVLTGMGFDRVFYIIRKSEAELEKMREIPPITSDKRALTRLLLESHRALMELNETNKQQFQDVVELFERSAEPLGACET